MGHSAQLIFPREQPGGLPGSRALLIRSENPAEESGGGARRSAKASSHGKSKCETRFLSLRRSAADERIISCRVGAFFPRAAHSHTIRGGGAPLIATVGTRVSLNNARVEEPLDLTMEGDRLGGSISRETI